MASRGMHLGIRGRLDDVCRRAEQMEQRCVEKSADLSSAGLVQARHPKRKTLTSSVPELYQSNCLTLALESRVLSRAVESQRILGHRQTSRGF